MTYKIIDEANMKELTKREAAILILGGGMVDCWNEDGDFAGTIRWSDEIGFIDKDGGWYRCLNYPKLVEHVEPRSVEIDMWVNIYKSPRRNWRVYSSKSEAVENVQPNGYIDTINIKRTVSQDIVDFVAKTKKSRVTED